MQVVQITIDKCPDGGPKTSDELNLAFINTSKIASDVLGGADGEGARL